MAVGLRQIVEAVATGTAESECLKERRDSRVVRTQSNDKRSIIVKLWCRPGWRGTVRQLMRTSVAHREWRAMRRLRRFGVRTPEPLAMFQLRSPEIPFSDAVCIEDLGKCAVAMDHLKILIREHGGESVEAFDMAIIHMTRQMVQAGVIDPDHGLHNIVVPPTGEPTRLDLETARILPCAGLAPRGYGAMLGRTMATYAFSVQPDLARAEAFARRLVAACRPGSRAIKSAVEFVDRAMKEQLNTKGIDSRLPLNDLNETAAAPSAAHTPKDVAS